MAESNAVDRAISSILSRMPSAETIARGATQRDPATRTLLLELAREIISELESPNEAISSLAYSGVHTTCVRIADSLDLFTLLSQSPHSTSELSAAVGAEEGLLLRLLRFLTATGFARQIDSRTFAATPKCSQMTEPSVRAGFRHFFDSGSPVFSQVPAYFQNNRFCLPQTSTDGPFQFAHQTSKDPYDLWASQPGVTENFNTFMKGRFKTRVTLHWLTWFPLKEVCLNGFDTSKSQYLFVDVGGAKGNDCTLVLHEYPDVKGVLVLEDTPSVIDTIQDIDSRIDALAYDFMKPQPIIGARTYLFKNILHNWPRSVCRTILTQTREAMIPGYSRILIVDKLLPDEGVSLPLAEMDMLMLFLHSGAERSVSEWKELAHEAGLNIVKFWFPPSAGDGVVELEISP